MDKIENGIFTYSDTKKIPSLVEIENAHRRATGIGAEKFAVIIDGEYFGYNPQKRGIYRLKEGEYQVLENNVELAKERDVGTDEPTETETLPMSRGFGFVAPEATRIDSIDVSNCQPLELLDELNAAMCGLIDDCAKKDMEIAELKIQMVKDCDRYKKFADMAREMNAKIDEMLK